jgi:serine/threonine-protein kinase
MLTGRPPFNCDSVGEFIAAHLKEDPPAPSELEPTIPPAVDALVMRCLAKNPEDRFESITEMQKAVERVLAEISDSGVNASATPLQRTPLATGFKSAYDVNRGNNERTADTTGHEWFVDSQQVSSAPISDEWETPKKRGVGRVVALAAALFVGLVGGLSATSYYLDDQTAVASPKLEAAASVDEPRRDVTHAREPAPPPQPAGDVAEADEQQAEPIVQPPAPVVKKAARPPRPRVIHPKPRRTVAPDDNEDLYDTR